MLDGEDQRRAPLGKLLEQPRRDRLGDARCVGVDRNPSAAPTTAPSPPATPSPTRAPTAERSSARWSSSRSDTPRTAVPSSSLRTNTASMILIWPTSLRRPSSSAIRPSNKSLSGKLITKLGSVRCSLLAPPRDGATETRQAFRSSTHRAVPAITHIGRLSGPARRVSRDHRRRRCPRTDQRPAASVTHDTRSCRSRARLKSCSVVVRADIRYSPRTVFGVYMSVRYAQKGGVRSLPRSQGEAPSRRLLSNCLFRGRLVRRSVVVGPGS